MGLPCFSKIIKYASLALVGSVVAIVVIIALSSPAAADPDGGDNSEQSYSWDTDNLRYGSYNARSFNIPFHDYDNYSSTVVACQSGVADAFFQTFSDSVNDFPYLTKGSGNSG